mgnify:CR=1 FL=1
MRGRNAEWAEKAVREAVSLSAEEALKLGVIDLIAEDVSHLLQQLPLPLVRVLQRLARVLRSLKQVVNLCFDKGHRTRNNKRTDKMIVRDRRVK